MRIRFQADLDVNPVIGRGLVRREPAIDCRPARNVIADATPDIEVLRLAAHNGRALVSRDVSTILDHFTESIAHRPSRSVVLIPPVTIVAEAIDKLLIA